MEQSFPAEGFFDLSASDLFGLACEQYTAFYAAQTPVNAFLVSVTLFHLLDWLVKNGTKENVREKLAAKDEAGRSAEEALVLKIHGLEAFRAVISAANNAKHHTLDGKTRPAYGKRIKRGFFTGVSRVGDSLGTEYLILDVDDKPVWLRDAFWAVLDTYREYFQKERSPE
ncbi:hypothetical protein CH72_3108 [Burkholderia ambifaria AMMD]|uniref:Uncharacterized protein n=1 Tax=Burkholderia ambifaria (strain ATCC BAA-244 / DSM 16087 / CCUG 44356 / LMG 19182 / AMMD) TaxID=339670 RepID=Q0BF10_BURCM|nr:hypothetical protein [Burkholderia ambifaria]ABI87263.1 hypothetical protein Bamb_1706 [Burkholderia ambifaria AMMD]AJY22646.1 hypothetical protein CH72_3108 [Burkholderia ambifaria AMMD]MBR7928750.1 hypothetical protein [Burkholderia ambifaria]PEH65521.1 hypothetical protein CRM91_24565 [Burkholderia ambifaria]QQC05523.1 hypothetical protein I6H84_06370 [Burkholderia ambifaria]